MNPLLIRIAITALLVLVFPSHGIHIEGKRRGMEARIGSHIVGGYQANSANHPYFVEWDFMGCGGSLIHEDIILSAAHCFSSSYTSPRVWIGSGWVNDGIPRNIINFTMHPKYNASNDSYDFLLMKLDEPVTSVEPIELNRNPSNPTNVDLLTVIGFGDLEAGSGQGSWTLQEVKVNHVPQETCNEQYRGYVQPDIMFCAGNRGKDSCQGDSGGPIMDANGVQVGLVSFGSGCGLVPGVYARVSSVIDWIDKTICELSSNPPLRCKSDRRDSTGNDGGGGRFFVINGGVDHIDNEANTNGNIINVKGVDDIYEEENINTENNMDSGTGVDVTNSVSSLTIRIEIAYEENAKDIAWGLLDDNTWEDIYWSNFEEVTQSGSMAMTFDLEAGNYWFVAVDRSNHGIREGYFEITDITLGGNTLLWKNDLTPGSIQQVIPLGV